MNKSTLITLIMVKRKVNRDPILKSLVKRNLEKQSILSLKIQAKTLNIPINN